MAYPTNFQLLLFVLVLTISSGCVPGQGRSSSREQTRAIERADMDRLLLFATPKDKEPEAVRESRFKKIKDDFRSLQSLNNKMMADAWLQDALDYSSIADMVSKIRGKANDLKDSLSLPEAEKSDAAEKMPAATTARQFRERLLLLDKTIMRFVTNPVFQATNTLNINQAKNASADLDQVIALSDDLKQNAQKLRTPTH